MSFVPVVRAALRRLGHGPARVESRRPAHVFADPREPYRDRVPVAESNGRACAGRAQAMT
ncbi:MAG: hypothetical protein OHK0026_02780 [Rhodocyclaceae bacterium]